MEAPFVPREQTVLVVIGQLQRLDGAARCEPIETVGAKQYLSRIGHYLWNDTVLPFRKSEHDARHKGSPVADAIADARVLDAARESASSGTVVHLDPPAGHVA